MRGSKEKVVSAEALDIKEINEQLANLSHDKLMYVAGAIAALAAVGKAGQEAHSSA